MDEKKRIKKTPSLLIGILMARQHLGVLGIYQDTLQKRKRKKP